MKDLLNEIVYPKLSYRIVSILFSVYNALGPNHYERVYQRGVAESLKMYGFRFKEQVYMPVNHLGRTIGRYYLDFLIEDKIILELKSKGFFQRTYIDQLNAYLRTSKMKLAILACFSANGVLFRRIVNTRA